MSTTQAQSAMLVTTPMQKVTNSVARKSTTIGRLDLLPAASMQDPIPGAGPSRALLVIAVPEKGVAGREKRKAAEELWREHERDPECFPVCPRAPPG
jgi:hypothetical protein